MLSMRNAGNNANLNLSKAPGKTTSHAIGARAGVPASIPKRPVAHDPLAALNKSPQPSARPSSPKRRGAVPPLPTVPNLLEQCVPNCLSSRGKEAHAKQQEKDAAEHEKMVALKRSSPSSVVVKRPNGQFAHLLQLPSSVPYALRLHAASPQGTVHVLPVLSPAVAAFIREDAERTAKRLGGWAPRAVGCCTNDVLVSQLSAQSQQYVFDAFKKVIMPFAIRAFPDAKLTPDSLPRSVECFFIIKYKADKSRREFGEHIDHTKLTVNLSLTSPETDFDAGGLFFPCARGLQASDDKEPPTNSAVSAVKKAADGAMGMCSGVAEAVAHMSGRRTAAAHKWAAQQSKGLLLRAGAGTAVIHHGDIKHAGDKVEGGERLQLVAFFYGGERRGNALPLAVDSSYPKPPASPASTRMTMTRMSAGIKPPSRAVVEAAAAVKEFKEPQRLVTLDDVSALARDAIGSVSA